MDHQQNVTTASGGIVDHEAHAMNKLDKSIINEEMIRIASTKRLLFIAVKNRKMSFVGYVMRHDSLQRDLLEGKVLLARKRDAKTAMECHHTMDRSHLQEGQAYCPRPKKMGGSLPATSIGPTTR